ncbi:MAG: RNA methyltransferase [Gemmataceae bacterium]|nr:RNA methyltransferase [Gemmataceae bacterium]
MTMGVEEQGQRWLPADPAVARACLQRCRIVLVRPQYAGNLGAVARLMRNFGLRDLVLVAPRAQPSDLEARRLAVHGLSILDAARIVPDLGSALAECVYTLATSAETAGLQRRGRIAPPRQLMPVLAQAALDGPVALVFGPEPHGLTLEEVNRCHAQLFIPADPDYPALNLAQAVAICCYEWYLHWQAAVIPPTPVHADRQPASHAELERMFQHLRQGLEAVGYLFGDRQEVLMSAVRYLLARARPTVAEVRMLHGLARQLLWIARQAGRSLPPDASGETPSSAREDQEEGLSAAGWPALAFPSAGGTASGPERGGEAEESSAIK